VVHGDPAQFLFADGRITCIYDFEATHIGDPLHDVAALRLRHAFEPLGADPDYLVRHYAAITGTPIDTHAFSFHTAALMIACVISLAGPLSQANAHEIEFEYLVMDLMCRRAMLAAMGEIIGIPLTPSPRVEPSGGRSELVWRMLEEKIGRMGNAESKMARYERESALALTQWAQGEAVVRATHETADLDRAGRILGSRPSSWREADAALEKFVQSAGPESDAQLFDYFARQTEDRIAEAVPVRDRLAGFAVKPLRL
jgi:hypothetical protein